MNLDLSVNPTLQALEIRPYSVYNNPAQLAWFYVLYADKGIVDAVANYLDATEVGFVFSSFTKTVTLGPLWDTAQDLGLIQAIGSSMRITIPYYEPIAKMGPSELLVGDNSYRLLKSSSPAQMGLQEQIVNSGFDIQMALARASLKALTASKVGEAGGEFGGLLAMAGKLTAQLTDAAETRNWLLLPSDVRIRRVALEPGTHQLTLDSTLQYGRSQRQQTSVTLESGDIHLWQVRSLAPAAEAQPGAVKALVETAN